MSQPRTTSALVGAPLLPTLTKLAIPGVLGASIQSLLPVVEAWYLSSAGTIALAAVAIVFPLIMLANMFSAGAIGGATSGAVARALGAGDLARAAAVLRSAVLIGLVGGTLMGGLLLFARPALFDLLGASDVVSSAAMVYAGIAFAGMPLIWLFNMLGSVLRGAGDMVRPAIGMLVNVVAYAALGAWLMPDSANSTEAVLDVMKAGAIALVGAYLIGTLVMFSFVLNRAQPVRLNGGWPRADVTVAVLKPGLLAASQSLMTVIYALVATALLGRLGVDWLAGYGLAVRLELLMIPVIFGIGASLIAIVGAHAGAGLRERAIQIAWRGTAANVVAVGLIGLAFALMPQIWCTPLSSATNVATHCGQTLQILGPFYGFFALGLGLYFASQGLNTLLFPVAGAGLRLLIVMTGLLWVSDSTGPNTILWTLAGAMVAYGLFVSLSLKQFAWRQQL
ncbi:MAG: MATE family efflux transporter [Burkholderiaceae bacterium]